MTKHPLHELKTAYRVLHRSLIDYPELMESGFLDELQRHLQTAAMADGVDISDHGAWDAWLSSDVKVRKLPA